MNAIEKIEWDSKYSVGIEEIDACQKKMFELFNQLIDIKKSETDTKTFINMIADINDYSKLYFSTEEKYLRKNGYPDLKTHLKAHRQFTKSFIGLRREIMEDIANLTDDMILELRGWMINHILTLDAFYIPFLRVKKYIDESKQKK